MPAPHPILLRIASLSLFAWLTTTPAASCQRSDSPDSFAEADSCLPRPEFELRGLGPGDDGPTALERLGKSVRVKSDSGEDDGGRYELRTYYYRDLELDIVRGRVDRVATHSPTVASPSGLRPGLTREAVRRLLLTKGVTFKQSADTMEIASCHSPKGNLVAVSITLAFDRTHHVRALWMAEARP